MSGKELDLMLPRQMLNYSSVSITIDLKWADNIQKNETWSDFTLNGDAAPPDEGEGDFYQKIGAYFSN